MKFIYLCLLAFLPLSTFAETAAEIESRVQSKLEAIIARVLPDKQYVLQVVALGEKRMERELVEGESVINNAPKAPSVPALPGFSTPPPPPSSSGGSTRQVFRSREKFDLKTVNVHLLADSSLSDESVKKAQEVLNGYLKLEYPGKSTLSTARASLLKTEANPLLPRALNWIPWALTALALFIAAFTFWYLRRSKVRESKPEIPEMFPEIYSGAKEDQKFAEKDHPRQIAFPNANQLTSDGSETLGNESFPPLPANEQFTDRRVELLEAFLQDAEIFRVYFLKLSEGSRAELYSGLRGPAFDSLLDTLNLSIPKDGIPTMSPNEDQVAFYLKNFREYLKSFEWQDRQFFGFLHNLDDSQLVKLAQQQNSLVLAVILNFLGPEKSARVLDHIPRDKRLESMAQLDRCKQLSLTDLREMEKLVRIQAEEMPRFGSFQQKIDMKFWAKLLSRAENQDQILLDLEQVHPELYPKLAKYRFKLDDLPMLPKGLIQKTLDSVENNELAAAFVGADQGLLNFMLNELSQERRSLIENQILVNQGLPPAVVDESKNALTRRFREVML